MAQQPISQERRDKKLNLTLDEYYDQYVRTDSNEEQHRSHLNGKLANLTLDEYYAQFVLPKLQPGGEEEEQRRNHYQRTHYFAPSYLKQRQLGKPGATVQKRSTERE